MKALLIYPPGWNPSSPYLALPILKSYLHEKGEDVSISDLNVDFFDYILSEEYLNYCLKKNYSDFTSDTVKNTLKMISGCTKEISYAKNTMRSSDYLDPAIRKHVDTIISNALYIINNTCHGLKIGFNNMELLYNRNSSDSVYKACYDDVANPYIDFYKKNVIPVIKKEKYKFVGLSITGHTQLISALTLCRMIKEECPNVIHIALGGNYITRSADRLCNCGKFNNGFFDSIMLYDGEISCTELLKMLKNNESIDNVHNIIYLKDGLFYHTSFKDSNEINTCTPDFTGFPLDKYFAPSMIYPIYTSRGCYNKCAFCTIPNATSGKYKAMSINDVIKNIKNIKEKHNAQFFSIVDETFDIKRMVKLAEALIDAQLNIYWYCETRFSEGITREICEKLYKSGCRQIQFGLESYNQRVLDKMRKNVKIEWVDKAIDNCMASGISVHMFFFTGFPTETIEEALRTYKYTSKKVTESQVKYNVISSRGYGSFGLEMGSSVWLYPEKYGVTPIKNGLENDLRLNVNYEVNCGLTQKESEEVVKSQNLRDGISNQEFNEFELPNMDFVPEIHMVVKVALSPGIKEHQIKKMLSYKSITSLIKNKMITIPSYINISSMNNMTLLYNKHLNQAYAIPNDMLKRQLSYDSFYYDEVFSSNNKISLRLVSELEHFGFVVIDGVCDEYVENWGNLKLLKSNTLKTYYNNSLNEWAVINRVTNDSTAVNKLSYKLLYLFDEPRSFDDVCTLLKNNSIELSQVCFYQLVDYYLRHDILYTLC